MTNPNSLMHKLNHDSKGTQPNFGMSMPAWLMQLLLLNTAAASLNLLLRDAPENRAEA